VLKNVRVKAGQPLEDATVRQAIADAENELAKTGRLLIRPSGTEPLIRVMAEGDDRAQVERIVDELVGVIGSVRNAA
jgi:phosphoglucosamine mutase